MYEFTKTIWNSLQYLYLYYLTYAWNNILLNQVQIEDKKILTFVIHELVAFTGKINCIMLTVDRK
jgi:hypothetical protein